MTAACSTCRVRAGFVRLEQVPLLRVAEWSSRRPGGEAVVEVAISTLGTARPMPSDHEFQNSLVRATVSIESFDVEPVDHRRLFRWLLGLVAAVTGVLAIIGWPLPAAPGRYVPSDAWERTTTLVQVVLGTRWSNHSQNHDARSTIFVYGFGLAVAVGLPFLQGWVMRGREESDDGGSAFRR